ncbi:SMI1/KNR4 family protein [Pendulispora brunnea]|uniref:SMI1/KNR4 family protein n=1 Tax=Pendulispora brunnea TaxID=2905690 RepID=A0ABZ2K328_9BACT
MIEKFIAYASSYNPTFEHSIRGASPAEIQHAETLVGRPLPEYYRRYLIRMGHDDAGLKPVDDGAIKIENLIRYYTDSASSSDPLVVPPDCIIIANPVVFDVCLYCGGGSEPTVYHTEADTLYQLYAESLEKLLFQYAFRKYRMPLYPHTVSLGAPMGEDIPKLLKPAGEFAERMGFQRQWFSDSVRFCGETTNAAISMVEYEQEPGLGIRIDGTDRAELELLETKFRKHFDEIVR